MAGLLILLSLASYLPEDPSLNTAVATGTLPHNWIGPAGAYVADGLFQVFGWVAYLLPLALLVVGARWLLWRGLLMRRAPKWWAPAMLLVSLGALLELFPYTPAIHGASAGRRADGVLGGGGVDPHFQSAGRKHRSRHALPRFPLPGHSVLLWLGGGIPAKARQPRADPTPGMVGSWQEARAAKAATRERRQLERRRMTGKPPVLLQKVAAASHRRDDP